jgi:hypothetical protein
MSGANPGGDPRAQRAFVNVGDQPDLAPKNWTV